MKKQTLLGLTVFALLGVQGQPAFCVSKETLQMMQQLDTLQQAVTNLQKTVDTQSAVLKTLAEQANDNVNGMKAAVTELQNTLQQNLASSTAKLDSASSQVQALSESLDEAKARLSKLGEQMTQLQNIMTTLPPPGGAPPPGAPVPGPGAATGPAPAPIPDANSLYTQGLSYYSGGQYDLAMQSFQDYLKFYKDTDRASNAQFYIGECYSAKGDYAHAIEAYDLCNENYPAGNKAAASQLKKGFALLAMEQKTAGVRELRSLLQRFPDSPEAELARQRLKKLGIAVSATATPKKKT